MENEVVVVGTQDHHYEALALVETLKSLEIPTVVAPDHRYIRDTFIYREGRVIPSELNLEGGNLIFGRNFILLGDEEATPKNLDALVETFPEYIVYPITSRYGHIDLRVGVIPSEDIITVNVDYLDYAESLKEIARLHNQELIPTRPEFDNQSYGILHANNYSVWENGGDPIVVANKATPAIVSELERKGVRVEQTTIPIAAHPVLGHGSIRCMTNICTREVLDELGIRYQEAA